ncbi:response regulator transcription factor [Paenibacillus hemerocallicola]|uniref:Response regulator transcription factor n=1 Tax=Paenibacillus hemerocallicola TaxID=1172614 RepID=A0A5C4T7Z9_9BACL|nr:response regulator transcription factor [Paenibacillus hemerocallicola]TNJ65062.1 response regulator transcription factor [Paenibacillus hemerocallicola]
MKRNIRTIVVDDHPVVARATKHILEQVEGVDVVGIAANGQAGIELVEEHQPDLLFLDYHLPDQYGSQVAEKAKRRSPNTHIVIFTGIDLADMYNHLIEIGVSGIISKESGETTIQNLVRCILDNHTMIPIPIYRQMRITSRQKSADTEFIDLSPDEIQIMTLLVKGVTHEQIADQIHVSKRSVDNYLKKIYDKLDVTSRIQAIEKFVRSPMYVDLQEEI